MRLDLEWIDDFERFRAIGDAWDGLARKVGSPFVLHRWYVAWWEAFGAGRPLRVLTLWEGDRVAAAMPMYAHGRELHWMSNSHTPVAAPIYAGDSALERLVAAATADGDRLALQPFVAGAPHGEALVARVRSTGQLVVDEHDRVSPYVATGGDWEEYRGLMKRKWSSAERKARKMAREHSAEFTIVEQPRDLGRELASGFEVEASGWKGREGTAITSEPDTAAFYTAVAQAFEATGELALSAIELDGRCVAFDLCLLHQRRLYLLKTGFDERFGSLSPGLVLRYLVVQRCFERGLETHELLGDDAEWKRRFATGERRYFRARVFPRTPAGVARYGYRAIVRPPLRSVYRALARRRA
jgi:CelD/BcsL family acetyltransferase involved in cellulose biosynthesis